MQAEPGINDFDALIDQARAVALSGWDFSFLAGRIASEALPWSYVDLATEASRAATRVLDIDTGGGELLALINPPQGSVAVEPYPPNVAVATAALASLGVQVRPRTTSRLPVSDAAFDLVLNRHGTVDADEVSRVLQPGGVFLTQQVGSDNDVEFNDAFGLGPAKFGSALDNLEQAGESLEATGLTVTRAEEAWPRSRYLDVGAVVLQLRAVPWQVLGFDVDRHRKQLQVIHQQILRHGAFTVTNHRLLLEATRT
jgi:SAM-dependent methyltransferase